MAYPAPLKISVPGGIGVPRLASPGGVPSSLRHAKPNGAHHDVTDYYVDGGGSSELTNPLAFGTKRDSGLTTGAYGVKSGLPVIDSVDPFPMFKIKETRAMLERIAAALGADMKEVVAFAHELQRGDIWRHAHRLKAGTDPVVRVWMIAANAQLAATATSDPTAVRKAALHIALKSPGGIAELSHRDLAAYFGDRFDISDIVVGIPIADSAPMESFLAMAFRGYPAGVVRDGERLIVGGSELDYSVLETKGLMPVDQGDQGQHGAVFRNAEGEVIVKRLSPQVAIVFNRAIEIALTLADTAFDDDTPIFTESDYEAQHDELYLTPADLLSSQSYRALSLSAHTCKLNWESPDSRATCSIRRSSSLPMPCHRCSGSTASELI